MNINDFTYPSGTVSRRDFALWGFILFAIKYNLDRLVALSFGKYWLITSYIDEADHLAIGNLEAKDREFYLWLAALAVPFMLAGVVLCLKRLRDAQLARWLVVLFFVPVINIFFFFILCVLPSKESLKTADEKPRRLASIIPKSRTGSILFAVGVPVFISLMVLIFSIDVMGEYGWGLFMAIPFVTAMSAVLLYAYHHQPVGFRQAVGLGLSGVLFFAIVLFVAAMEGIICIAMAAPIGFALGFIGSVAGYAIQYQPQKATLNSIAVSVFLLPLVVAIESAGNKSNEIYAVKTCLHIDASPQTVWNNLISFNKIEKPDEWLFKTGIAYPDNAEIFGKGVGAVRHCNFTTGAFIEPITIWDEPRLLKFDVLQQPPPMTELSFYKNIDAPHLEGYFTSHRGQFRLIETADHQTILEGTTWYQNRIFPSSYWKLWSDFILHKIHLRVLKHIKKESEKERI